MERIHNLSECRQRHGCGHLAAAGIALALFAAPAFGADNPPWANEAHSVMRLIAGAEKPMAKHFTAGVELELEPGWHTYWRYPGDSGVPPRFNFAGSENLGAVSVRYPAPHAFTDETGTTLGYKNRVVFPLEVTPKQAGQPVKLHLTLDYAICDQLCVPAQKEATLTLPGIDRKTDAILAAAEARVPTPVAASVLGLTVHRVDDDNKPTVLVDVAAKNKPLQLFVEGPTAEWALPIPKPVEGAPAGEQRFTFRLDGLPPGTKPQSPTELTFTVIAGDHAYQTKAHLD